MMGQVESRVENIDLGDVEDYQLAMPLMRKLKATDTEQC